MSTLTVILAFVSALGSGLVAGAFYAFSTFVMAALGRLPAPQGIAAMQSINVTVINPWFMSALFGTALACLATIVAALADWDGSYGPYLVAGAALYVLGTTGVTMAFNVPRNNALEKAEATAPDAATLWTRYLTEWTAWNTVRTAAALIASALFVAGLYVGGDA